MNVIDTTCRPTVQGGALGKSLPCMKAKILFKGAKCRPSDIWKKETLASLLSQEDKSFGHSLYSLNILLSFTSDIWYLELVLDKFNCFLICCFYKQRCKLLHCVRPMCFSPSLNPPSHTDGNRSEVLFHAPWNFKTLSVQQDRCNSLHHFWLQLFQLCQARCQAQCQPRCQRCLSSPTMQALTPSSSPQWLW